jgi:hypothetical protein
MMQNGSHTVHSPSFKNGVAVLKIIQITNITVCGSINAAAVFKNR